MITVTPIGPAIGAEISNIDLRVTPNRALAEQLNSALLTHHVLVIRNQTLDPIQYRNALSVFGPPMLQHRAEFNLDECPQVSRVINREGFPPAVNWHTDHTNHEKPPKLTALYGVEIPSHGGDTAFANMVAAYRSLPLDEQTRLRGMFTLNSMEPDPSYSDSDRSRYPGGIRHPMVRIHPETEQPSLYFHVSKSQGIEGMPSADVRPYLESLLERTIHPDFTYRHAWQRGDVVICDNRCTMHRVHADYQEQDLRLLWRIIIEGDRPAGPAI